MGRLVSVCRYFNRWGGVFPNPGNLPSFSSKGGSKGLLGEGCVSPLGFIFAPWLIFGTKFVHVVGLSGGGGISGIP